MSEPVTLRELVRWARREYALEAPPLALHEGPDHIGEGGVPKMTRAMLRYLSRPPWAVDPLDPAWYETPIRAALARVARRYPLSSQVAQLLAMGEFSAGDVVALVAPATPPEFVGYIAMGSMRRLYRAYSEHPERSVGWVDLSESQQKALDETDDADILTPAEYRPKP